MPSHIIIQSQLKDIIISCRVINSHTLSRSKRGAFIGCLVGLVNQGCIDDAGGYKIMLLKMPYIINELQERAVACL